MPKLPDSVLSTLDSNRHLLGLDVLAETYAKLLDRNGYVLLTDVPDDFDHVGFLVGFGPFMPSPTGELVGDIAPEDGMDGLYYGNNKAELVPHTEGYEFAGPPPRYLALWCAAPWSGDGGATTLLDGRPLYDALDEQEQAVLRATTYEWQCSEGLRARGIGMSSRHPVFESWGTQEILRFSYNNLVRPADDNTVASFLERGKQRFDDLHISITYQKNDLLQWDNWRMLHSRTAFKDSRRHLKRVMIKAAVCAEPSP